jgi:N-acetylneuraminic acid mutarotase
MNAHRTFDRDLERWLEAEAPEGGPAGLHEAAMERARTMRQRPRLIASLRGGAFPSPTWPIGRPAVPMAYLLLVLGLVLALIVGAIAAGTIRSQPVRVPGWSATGEMTETRSGHTATLLLDGTVLVAGTSDPTGASRDSAELYDPGSRTWTASGSMITPRSGHTETLLLDGTVLVTGGLGPDKEVRANAELYDPSSRKWIATRSMIAPRVAHTATLLTDGRVLVAGGFLTGFSAELYDPGSRTWTATGRMATSRVGHTATLLNDGTVLVTGDAPAELYDPDIGSWTATGTMTTLCCGHTATLLPDGRVLVTGGWQSDTNDSDGVTIVPLAVAELYDPSSRTWTGTGSMTTSRDSHTATLLPDGRVLVTGGWQRNTGAPDGGVVPLAAAELYDPATATWTATWSMSTPRESHTATLLPDGTVLVTGGTSAGASAELYDPRGQ